MFVLRMLQSIFAIKRCNQLFAINICNQYLQSIFGFYLNSFETTKLLIAYHYLEMKNPSNIQNSIEVLMDNQDKIEIKVH